MHFFYFFELLFLSNFDQSQKLKLLGSGMLPDVAEEEGKRRGGRKRKKEYGRQKKKVRCLDGTAETCLWNFRGCISSSFFFKIYDDVNN